MANIKIKMAPPGPPMSALPEMFRRLVGNLSKVMTAANLSVVVDITSTWHGDLGGPEYLSGYAKAAPTSVRFMDMATYFAAGAELKLPALKRLLPLQMIAPAVGVTELPGHENASCGGWPQCANLTNPACGCLNYSWNHSAFAAFVRRVESLGISEIDVWRQDMTPPPGTTASVPPWLMSELAGFLKRGQEQADTLLSALNPGYGGRASPSKGAWSPRDGPNKRPWR